MGSQQAPHANPPSRLLLGPGPGMPHPRVMNSLSAPTLGHLDPYLIRIFEEEQRMLRHVFRTENAWTFALSGTGTAGMEAALVNLIEPGDQVLACVHGYFGGRLADMAARVGAGVDRLERPQGEIFPPEQVAAALSRRHYKLITLVHAETSTGVEQKDVREIAAAAHAADTLLLLDTVTSLGGIAVDIDGWDVDVAYSASQKNLGAPSGLAPITVGARAREVVESRKTAVSSFNLDLSQYWKYWNGEHAYHHTASSALHLALHEGLRVIIEDGLQQTIGRYRHNAEALWTGLENIGVRPFIPIEYRLPVLTTASVPLGVKPHDVRVRLLDEFNIEIASGFGLLKDKVWRIGLMGYSSRPENVTLLLAALASLIQRSS